MRMIECISMFLITIFFSSCGNIEKAYDRQNYESITNEKGDLYMISGGDTVATYLNCKIKYADANSQTILIKTNDNKEIYIQGDVIFNMK